MTTVNDPRTTTTEPGARVAWQLAPVVVLRQAGFPMELLAPWRTRPPPRRPANSSPTGSG